MGQSVRSESDQDRRSPLSREMNRQLKCDGGGAKKKMVIKPFKSQPRLPDDFEGTSWKLLEAAVEAVCTNTSIDTSKEVLYRTVEDLCLHKYSSSIYEKLYDKCKAHVQAKVDRLNIQVRVRRWRITYRP